jgi:hypothetical protein
VTASLSSPASTTAPRELGSDGDLFWANQPSPARINAFNNRTSRLWVWSPQNGFRRKMRDVIDTQSGQRVHG